MPQYTIDITEHRTSSIVEHSFLDNVIRQVLVEEQIDVAAISLALMNDAEIRELNRQFLGHDYPTDVISFRLDDPIETEDCFENVTSDELSQSACLDLDSTTGIDSITSVEECRAIQIEEGRRIRGLTPPARLEGELIVSTETAIREARLHGWSPQAELILYVVHGMLHLCGYDDLTDEARPVMRSRERQLLSIWGFCPTGLEQ